MQQENNHVLITISWKEIPVASGTVTILPASEELTSIEELKSWFLFIPNSFFTDLTKWDKMQENFDSSVNHRRSLL